MPPPAAGRARLLGFPPRIALGFGAAIASVVVAGLASSLALSARTESSRLAEEVSARRLALEEVESALLVAHTALEAYLATGDGRHRERHERAAAKIGPSLAALAALVPGEERADAERLARVSGRVRAWHGEALALAAAGDVAAALALQRGDALSAALERVAADVDRLVLHAAAVSAERQAAWTRSITTSNVVFLLAHAALLVLVFLAVRLVREEMRAREEHEAARERAFAVQRRLLAVVSHDLRNPLTGILAAGWALTRAELPRDLAPLARRVVVAGRRMERLIRDLLDWSRVHGEVGIPVAVCDADVHDVCRRIADELSERQAERVLVEREGDTRAVFDPDRMEQIVANLVGNALKYAPADTPVRLRAVGEDAAVRVEVRDEGPGLPPEVRAELFEPFRRGRGAEAVDETSLGLGLFIVRTLAEAQGARVEVESGPAGGTTFSVRVPRRPAAARPEAVASRRA